MKLLCEVTEEIKLITEEASNQLYIQGKFCGYNEQNLNKRIYPKTVLESEVNNYVKNYIEPRRALGELGHPASPTINLDRAAILVTELFDTPNLNGFSGKALVLNTPMGQVTKALLESGVKLGVSTRGVGSVIADKNSINIVQNDFKLSAIDVVADPSAPNAFVESVMEDVEWVFDNGNWKMQEAVSCTKKMGKQNAKKLRENAIDLFAVYMNSLIQK